jgi:hypothetical protein
MYNTCCRMKMCNRFYRKGREGIAKVRKGTDTNKV